MFLNEALGDTQHIETVEGSEALAEAAVRLGVININGETLSEDAGLEALQEKSIVKLDKQARLRRLQVAGAEVIAREKKDPMIAKLEKARKAERTYEEKLMQRYGNAGLMRAKKVIAQVSAGTVRVPSLKNPTMVK